MSIIRQISQKISQTFAVPDLRNSATVVRLLIVVISSLLLFPLISESKLGYTEEIYRHLLWVAPVLFLILLKAFFVNSFLPSLRHSKHAFFISYFINLVIFLFVELCIFKKFQPSGYFYPTFLPV